MLAFIWVILFILFIGVLSATTKFLNQEDVQLNILQLIFNISLMTWGIYVIING